MTLHDRLTDIDGIGDSRADEILELVGDTTGVKEDLETALAYMDNDNAEYARKFIENALEDLE